MKERYIYREEPSISEPAKNPIRGILFDRESGRYNLLDSYQRDLVCDATEGKIGNVNEIKLQHPFRVDIELLTLEGNVKKVKLPGEPVKNVLSAPISAYSEFSARCNLNCRDCYQGQRDNSGEVLSSKEIEELLRRYSDLGILIVRLTGKEPTTHPDLLKFISLGESYGLKMALNTNGVFKPSFAHDLVDAGLKEVVISLDGDKNWNDYIRGRGVYENATRNLAEFAKAGIDTRINMTVSKSNIKYIEHIAQLAHSVGSYVSYIPMRDLGNASERMQNELFDREDMRKVSMLITSLRKKYFPTRLLTYFDILGEEADYYHPMFQLVPCNARKNIFLDNCGNVYPCDHLVNLGDVFRGGNIRNTDLLMIWRAGKGLERYRSLEFNNRCSSCKYMGRQCNGGCTSEFLVKTDGQAKKVEDRLCFYNPDKETKKSV